MVHISDFADDVKFSSVSFFKKLMLWMGHDLPAGKQELWFSLICVKVSSWCWPPSKSYKWGNILVFAFMLPLSPSLVCCAVVLFYLGGFASENFIIAATKESRDAKKYQGLLISIS